MNVHVSPCPKNPIVSRIACSAFWSLNHPLNLAFQRAHGQVVDLVFYPANGFSLRQLIAFAEELPPEILASYADEPAPADLDAIEA